MDPKEFRIRMEELGSKYNIAQRRLQEMIYQLGIISQHVASIQGEDARRVYLDVQYTTFSQRLEDPRFAAAMSAANLPVEEVETSSE